MEKLLLCDSNFHVLIGPGSTEWQTIVCSCGASLVMGEYCHYNKNKRTHPLAAAVLWNIYCITLRAHPSYPG